MKPEAKTYRSKLGVGKNKAFERRVGGEIETRMSDDEKKSFVFRGLASRTEAEYEVYDYFGSYTEKVLAGAFKDTLKENPHVVYLIMHDGLPLANTKAGTLKLWESERGLEVEAEISLTDYRGPMIKDGVERGNITEMSIGFRVDEQTWNEEYDYRTIYRINLHRGDVSVVNFGANEHTEIDSVRGSSSPDSEELDQKTDKTTRTEQEPVSEEESGESEERNNELLLQQQLEEELLNSSRRILA